MVRLKVVGIQSGPRCRYWVSVFAETPTARCAALANKSLHVTLFSAGNWFMYFPFSLKDLKKKIQDHLNSEIQ